jgi:hypothetical protein
MPILIIEPSFRGQPKLPLLFWLPIRPVVGPAASFKAVGK